MSQNRFCFLHVHQQQNPRLDRTPYSGGPRPDGVYGIRRDGLPCILCISQKKFCHLHVHQQP
jgi:hypothetical protein